MYVYGTVLNNYPSLIGSQSRGYVARKYLQHFLCPILNNNLKKPFVVGTSGCLEKKRNSFLDGFLLCFNIQNTESSEKYF